MPRPGPKTSTLRALAQFAVFALAIYGGAAVALGWSRRGIETFCPFGGIETLWAVLTHQSFACATGHFNLALMVALLGATLVARKAFCSWICPVGTVSEWLTGLARRLPRSWRKGPRMSPGLIRPSPAIDASLRWLRIAVLVAIVVATAASGELLFRPFDPYYVLFSMGGHDVAWWSYPLLAILLGAVVIVPMAWCRYLCPLGGALWPFSKVGLLRIQRDANTCTACGRCDAVCPHGIAVATVPAVRSGECTLCMQCTAACPAAGALQVSTALTPGVALPAWSAGLVLVIATALGLGSAKAFIFPSYEQDFSTAPITNAQRVQLTVKGVRCVDTAQRAAHQLDGLPGVQHLVAYASEGRLVIDYDPALTTPEVLAAAMEGPVWDEPSASFLFNIYTVADLQPLAAQNAHQETP